MIRPYLINTKDLQTWDVILQHTETHWYRPSTWSSWVIRELTWSNYNHSGEILIIDEDIYVIESLGWWITLKRWEEFTSPDKYIRHLRMKWFRDTYHEKDYIIKALKQLDKPYDFMWIFKLFIYICFWRWDSPTKQISEDNWRCSEYNAWMKDLDWWQRFMPKDFLEHDKFMEVL